MIIGITMRMRMKMRTIMRQTLKLHQKEKQQKIERNEARVILLIV